MLWVALVVAACVITFANGLDGAFTYDDKAIIRDNPRLRSPRAIPTLFSTNYFGGPRGTGTLYRPLLLLSYAVQWWIHGRLPIPFHAVNLALHVLATVLVARLLARIGLSPPIAWSAALLFAVHPIHVEAVTSLVGRGETLTTVLVLLFLLFSLTAFESRRGSALAGAIGCYAVAVLTKESAVVAPALAVLLFTFLVSGSWRERIRAVVRRAFPLLAGCAVVLAGLFALRHRQFGGFLKSPATGFFEVENPLAPLPPLPRAANACLIFFRYLGRFALPLHLSADESAWSIRVFPLFSVLPLAAVALVLALAAAALARLPRRSPFALGFLFMAVAFLPTSNLLLPIGTIFAERLAYLPSIGACVIAAAVLVGGSAARRELDFGRSAVLAGVALLLAARSVTRNSVWWTDQGLFANSVATSPASAKAHYNMAYVSAYYRRFREALAQYTRAVEIYDGYWDAWAGKGRMEKELGMLDRAERSYSKAIAVYPGYENGYFGLGLVYEARGDEAAATRTYRRGLKDNPESLPLAFRLAIADSALGAPEASEDWRLALKLGSSHATVWTERATWLLREGRPADARRVAREALRRSPRLVAALRVVADADQREGLSFAEALAREKIFRITRAPEDREALERLASLDPAYGRRFRALAASLPVTPSPALAVTPAGAR